MLSKNLLSKINQRLDEVASYKKFKEGSIIQKLEEHGFSRRDFMKWASAMTAMLGLPATLAPSVAKAAELADRLPVLWLHMAECTGCSESLLRTDAPTIETLIFDYISLDYHETLMVAAGWQAEENLKTAMKKYKDKYILIVEGAIPYGKGEYFLTIGPEAQTGFSHVVEASSSAAAVFAVGTCSSYGGVQAARPNPTNAKRLSEISKKPVINVPGCPPSEKNIVGTLLSFILFGSLPPVDNFGRPKWAYGLRIHDLCERRGHFDAGEFVQQFGDEYAKKGFCLYKMGCKGPYTFNNCSRERFNQHTSWPVAAGHGCIGCSEPDFWDTMAPFEKPVADRLFHSVFDGLGADATADKIGIGILALTGVAIAAHAAIATFHKENNKGE